MHIEADTSKEWKEFFYNNLRFAVQDIRRHTKLFRQMVPTYNGRLEDDINNGFVFFLGLFENPSKTLLKTVFLVLEEMVVSNLTLSVRCF